MPSPSVASANPPVSVIMTALDEHRHLSDAVDSVFAQDYDGELELVVAVGPSRDDTMALAESLARRHADRMRVVVNPTGRTPHGLNIAIAATDQARTIVVRTDGHAQLPVGYVREAVETLLRTGAANVGGQMLPAGTTPFEQAVARAMSSRIGLGSAPFHVGGDEGPADSVYLGVFRRDIFEAVGRFDEHFVRAQDWELNYRIREYGATVWFDPRLQVGYRPRPNVRALARQFHHSGIWRWQIIQSRPDTASARYLAAPATTAALGLAAAAAVAGLRWSHPMLKLIARALPAGYLGAIALGATTSRRGLGLRASGWYPVALVTMHLSWGSGFLRGVVTSGWRRTRRHRPT